MRWLILISFTVCFFKISNAQLRRGWQLYFTENVDSLYTAIRYDIGTTANFRYPIYEVYPTFNLTVFEEANDEKINRVGFLLSAKSTRIINYTGEAFFGNELDSVHIWYKINEVIERTGRSALVSLINLFSKSEDKSPQDEPYYTYSHPITNGFIEFDDEKIPFSKDTLYRESHNIILQRIAKVKKLKTGKIKKANSYFYGKQLMKGDTCLAALDKMTRPETLYLLKSLNYKDRLIYTAFLTMTELSILHKEEE